MSAVKLLPNLLTNTMTASAEPDLERVRKIGSRKAGEGMSRDILVARQRRRAAKRDKLASELRRTLETGGAFKGG